MRRSDAIIDALHVAVLVSMAVVQPLLSVVGDTPELFRALDATPGDMRLMLLGCCVGLPLALLGLEGIARLAGPRPRRWTHGLIVTALTALAVFVPLRRALPLPEDALLAAALLVGVAAAVLLARWEPARAVLTYLTPVVVLFPALFVWGTPAGALVQAPHSAAPVLGPATTSPTPVVLLVLDEFPLATLLDDDAQVDAARHPGFASLARRATWFRNATTVASMTEAAVASILTGRLPGARPLTNPDNRLQNLFTLLGRSHELRVIEAYSPYCPASLCPPPTGRGRGARLRSLAAELTTLYVHVSCPVAWRRFAPETRLAPLMLRAERASDGAARAERLRHQVGAQAHRAAPVLHRRREVERFLDDITPSDTPALHFLHVLLPHEPYDFLPDGRACPVEDALDFSWVNASADDLPHQRWRLALQIGYVDRVIGQLVARLEQAGLWDSALVVIVADHGVSHRPGVHRRGFSDEGYCDIAPVPLFVKAPFQNTGRVDDRNVEVIDVLPTIAGALGITVPWSLDGASLIDDRAPARPHKTLRGPYWPDEPEASFFAAGPEVRRSGVLDRACLESPLVASPFDGPLVGRRVAELPQEPSRLRARVPNREAWRNVRLSNDVLPCVVTGRLLGAEALGGIELAVAVNGTVRATTRSWRRRGATGRFAVTLPAVAFVEGPNDVALYAVDDAAGRVVLRPVTIDQS